MKKNTICTALDFSYQIPPIQWLLSHSHPITISIWNMNPIPVFPIERFPIPPIPIHIWQLNRDIWVFTKMFFCMPHACADPQPTVLDQLKKASELKIGWIDSIQKSNVSMGVGYATTLTQALLQVLASYRIQGFSHYYVLIPIPNAWLIVFPFPWESHGTHGIPGFPIPMHISNKDMLPYAWYCDDPCTVGSNAALHKTHPHTQVPRRPPEGPVPFNFITSGGEEYWSNLVFLKGPSLWKPLLRKP